MYPDIQTILREFAEKFSPSYQKARIGRSVVMAHYDGGRQLHCPVMREFDLLRHVYQANAQLHKGVLIGPGDDMAMIEMGGSRLLAAVDQVVDGRHFRLQSTPIELIGRKAITRSLSDIAAMAAVPLGTLAAAVLPPDFGEDRANALFDAMRSTAAEFDSPLIGGDIAFHGDASHPLVCSVTVLARPLAQLNGRAITRAGAKAGDRICVTGPLGGSLESNGLGRHLTFEPRIQLAQQLAIHYSDRLHAMIDISDGLGRDASHIAEMSGVQIRLYADRIPLNPGCDWRRALSDGEDYELSFAVQPPVDDRMGESTVFEVGEVVSPSMDDRRSVVVVADGREFSGDQLGWQHTS